MVKREEYRSLGHLRVEKVPIQGLSGFAHRAEADPQHHQILPVTVKRALAQSENPVAAMDDIGLVVAYLDDQCAAYLGILPCQLKVEGKLAKVYALSTFYVDETLRGTGLAQDLWASTLELGYDILISGLSPAAVGFFSKTPGWFRPVGSVPYVVIESDPVLLLSGLARGWWDFRSLMALGGLPGSPSPGALPTEVPPSRPSRFRLWRSTEMGKGPRIGATKVTQVRPLERETEESPYPHFHRSIDTINWMIRHPWISDGSGVQLPYAFSFRRDLFQFHPFELSDVDSGERIGFVVFSLSVEGKHATVSTLDFQVSERRYISEILRLALLVAISERARLIGPEDFQIHASKSRILRRRTQRQDRITFLAPAVTGDSIFNRIGNDLRLTFCEGDIPFT